MDYDYFVCCVALCFILFYFTFYYDDDDSRYVHINSLRKKGKGRDIVLTLLIVRWVNEWKIYINNEWVFESNPCQCGHTVYTDNTSVGDCQVNPFYFILFHYHDYYYDFPKKKTYFIDLSTGAGAGEVGSLLCLAVSLIFKISIMCIN